MNINGKKVVLIKGPDGKRGHRGPRGYKGPMGDTFDPSNLPLEQAPGQFLLSDDLLMSGGPDTWTATLGFDTESVLCNYASLQYPYIVNVLNTAVWQFTYSITVSTAGSDMENVTITPYINNVALNVGSFTADFSASLSSNRTCNCSFLYNVGSNTNFSIGITVNSASRPSVVANSSLSLFKL